MIEVTCTSLNASAQWVAPPGWTLLDSGPGWVRFGREES